MSRVGLSVVVPVFNEARVLLELARRVDAAASLAAPADYEVLLVDDASTDQTAGIGRALALPRVRVETLPRNRGQFGATRAGLSMSAGELVAVLDGDLQDPPEHLPSLVAELASSPGLDVVFATKTERADAAWMRAGSGLFHAGAALLARGGLPRGAGSYCVMRRRQAAWVSQLPLRDCNLSAALAALDVRWGERPYVKAGRYDERSRVGAVRLAREALGSLALLTPPGRRWLRARLSTPR